MGVKVRAKCGFCGYAETARFGGVMASSKREYCGAICPTCRKLITVDLGEGVVCGTCGSTNLTLIGDETRVPGSHIPGRAYFESAALREEAWHTANKDRLTQEARKKMAEYRKRWAIHAKNSTGFIGELARELMARPAQPEDPSIPDTPWPKQGYSDAQEWVEAQLAAVCAHRPERYEGRHRCPSCGSAELLFDVSMLFD